MTDTLKHAEQQMLMARPWHAAEGNSIWEITGAYPGKKHNFTACLAMVAPFHVTGTERPLFFLISPAIGEVPPIDPDWITHARPLLLVHRDEPGTAYWADEQVWLS
jgi:hypothetical protein